MDKNANKLIKEIKINQKLRLKVLLISLIIFGCLLLGALTYLFVKITTVYVGIIALVILGLCVWFGIVTYKKAITNTQYQLYKNKLIVKSLTFCGEIHLSKVINVRVKTTVFDFLLRKTKALLISVKKENGTDRIWLQFICEDAQKLCDEIMSLAIKCREKVEKKEQKKTKIEQETEEQTEET